MYILLFWILLMPFRTQSFVRHHTSSHDDGVLFDPWVVMTVDSFHDT